MEAVRRVEPADSTAFRLAVMSISLFTSNCELFLAVDEANVFYLTKILKPSFCHVLWFCCDAACILIAASYAPPPGNWVTFAYAAVSTISVPSCATILTLVGAGYGAATRHSVPWFATVLVSAATELVDNVFGEHRKRGHESHRSFAIRKAASVFEKTSRSTLVFTAIVLFVVSVTVVSFTQTLTDVDEVETDIREASDATRATNIRSPSWRLIVVIDAYGPRPAALVRLVTIFAHILSHVAMRLLLLAAKTRFSFSTDVLVYFSSFRSSV